MSATGELSLEEYRAVVECSPAMIWRARRDGRLDYFNETWLAFTGRELCDEMGDGWTAGVHPDDLSECLNVHRSHFGCREPFEVEYRLRRHDGIFRYVFVRAVPLFSSRGSFAGFIGSSVDCEDRRKSTRGKATFLSLVAREMRGPLTAMKGYATHLRRVAKGGQASLEHAARRLERQVDRMNALVEQLAAAARIENGEDLVLEQRQLDLTELVVELVDAKTECVLEQRKATCAPGVGVESSRTPRLLEGDKPKLTTAIGHVIDNAIKFSRGGRIRISLSSSSRFHAVTVVDDGIGIPSGEIEDVTLPYVRGTNASATSYSGLGLGLAISKEIVIAHRGRLEVTSSGPRGTSVTVILPRTPEPS